MITGLYAGILGLMLVCLILRVVQRRWKYKVGIGDGGIPDLARAVRVHANFIETVPIILLFMLLMELGVAPSWFLHIYGIVLIGSRIMHSWGLSSTHGTSKGRFIGMVLTVLLVMIGSANLIIMYIV